LQVGGFGTTDDSGAASGDEGSGLLQVAVCGLQDGDGETVGGGLSVGFIYARWNG